MCTAHLEILDSSLSVVVQLVKLVSSAGNWSATVESAISGEPSGYVDWRSVGGILSSLSREMEASRSPDVASKRPAACSSPAVPPPHSNAWCLAPETAKPLLLEVASECSIAAALQQRPGVENGLPSVLRLPHVSFFPLHRLRLRL